MSLRGILLRLAICLVFASPAVAVAEDYPPPPSSSAAEADTGAKTPDAGGAAAAPGTASAALKAGTDALKRRDYHVAIAAFDRAIEAAPTLALAYSERAVARLGLGMNALAIDDLDRALGMLGETAAARERARLHANRGLAYLNQGKHPQALTDFDKAIALEPKMPFAYANRGMSAYQRKDYAVALADLTRALEARSNYEFALLVRGMVENDKKLFREAQADFQKVLAIMPEHRGAILGLRYAVLAGKAEEAARIKLVRQADATCEPACAEWIAIEGKIDAGAVEAFKAALAKAGKRKLPVLVDSGGGTVNEAMAIGRLIRANGLDVTVARTEFVVCARDDAACRSRTAGGLGLGRQQEAGSICASSCAFLIAAGANRAAGPSTLVGVHQITSFQTSQKVYRQYEVRRGWRDGKYVELERRVVSETRGEKKTVKTETTEATYGKVRKYFAEMGISEAVMPLLMSAPANSMHWLTGPELAATALRTAKARDN